MLFGLAIENILKAIIIAQNPQPAKDGKLREWPCNGHDLVSLAKEAKIELDKEQTDLVKRLMLYVEWAGRYPIPKKVTKSVLKQLSISKPFLPMPLQPYERKLFEQLFEHLLETAEKQDQ